MLQLVFSYEFRDDNIRARPLAVCAEDKQLPPVIRRFGDHDLAEDGRGVCFRPLS